MRCYAWLQSKGCPIATIYYLSEEYEHTNNKHLEYETKIRLKGITYPVI